MNKLLIKYEEEVLGQLSKDFQDVIDEISDYAEVDVETMEIIENVYFQGYNRGRKRALEILKDFN